jgi:hypothetical protein
MKLVIRCKQPLKYLLRCLEYALVAIAIPLLAYCAFVAIDARVFQAAEFRQLDLLLTESRAASAGTLHAGALARPESSLPFAEEGLIGRLEIARLGVSVIVIEGSSRTVLRRAAGHIRGTALPGAPRYLLPAFAEHPPRRCNHAQHRERRILLSRGFYTGGEPARRSGVGAERK